jgi:drug/metabolite transporter (DMT)-like permease
MSAARKPLDGAAVATMVLLCAIWGAQQVAIKVAAPDVAPVVQVALRCGLSAVLVGLTMGWRREPLLVRERGTWRAGLLAGSLFALEFLFIAEGLRHTTASHMTVFLYTSPIFTALGLHARLPVERLARHQWLGVGTAFCGIAIAFAGGWLDGGLSARMLWGDLLGVLAAALWAATTVVVRSSVLADAPATTTLLYQLACAFVALLLVGVGTGDLAHAAMTGTAWASLLFQGIVVSFASYLTWFSMLRRYLASRLSVFSFMTPLFGVSFGVLFLDEPIDLWFGMGAALVLVGITVVSAGNLLKRSVGGGRLAA